VAHIAPVDGRAWLGAALRSGDVDTGVQDCEVGPPGAGTLWSSCPTRDDGTTGAVLEVERARCDRGVEPWMGGGP
jgi:hypothetical protein